jgi:phospholipid/cholesterol/gamma-HCH transport system substrate-binding protein
VIVRNRVFRLRLLGVALFTLLAGAVFVYFLGLSGVDVLPHSTYTLHATAPDLVQLSDHADVLEAGVKVGSVTGLGVSGDTAQLTLSLDPRHAPVYRDGQIEIREKTLLGENYVDLDPGDRSSGTIRSGGTLPDEAPEAVQLDQILSTLSAPRRRQVQEILDDLAGGLGGRGTELNGFLGSSASLVENAAPVNAVLAGDREQVASLIDDFGSVAASLGERATAIRTLVRAALVTSRAVAARNADLRSVLAEAPSFTAQAQRTIAHLGGFSTVATPVVTTLRTATADLVPAVDELRPAAAEGTRIVDELGPFAGAAAGAAGALERVAPRVSALAVPLEAVLREVDPMMAYLVRYSLELGTIFPSMDGPTHYHDATANYGRVLAAYSNDVVTGAGPSITKILTLLQDEGAASPLAKTGYNPYPLPGTAAHPLPFSGTYPHIEPDPPYTFHPRTRGVSLER